MLALTGNVPQGGGMRQAIERRQPGLLTYGITPPKRSYSEEKRREVAARQMARIRTLPVDGLVIYDLQDESARTQAERPFPFLECVDPLNYAYDDLGDLKLPKVAYCCVAQLEPQLLENNLRELEANEGLVVFVGAASRAQASSLTLADAYGLWQRTLSGVPLGGVLIAERHERGHAEHERVLRKMDAGCTFFISQAAYSVVASKNVLSDLHYCCRELERPVPPLLLTLSPCGSRKTLEFLRWLGVTVPRWFENELVHSKDILATSVDLCVNVFEDLLAYAQHHGIPLGCNVESVSLGKAEIDASVELVERVASLLGRSAVSAP